MAQLVGFSVMEQLRGWIADEVYLPILVITADVTAATRQKALSLGAKDFLTKPVDMVETTLRVNNLLETRQLYCHQRELLERTLRGCVSILSEVLELVNPTAFGRTHRIRRYVQHMAQELRFRDRWQFDLAAMLSQIGCVSVPTDVLERSLKSQVALSTTEQQILSSQNQIGSNLLYKIPHLETIAQMVAEQSLPWPGNENSPTLVKLGAHLIKVASDFEQIRAKGESTEIALKRMRMSGQYNPEFLMALQNLQDSEIQSQTRWVPVSQLRPKMIASDGVYSRTGLLLLGKGREITELALARLHSFASLFGIVEPIGVILPSTTSPVLSVEPLMGPALEQARSETFDR